MRLLLRGGPARLYLAALAAGALAAAFAPLADHLGYEFSALITLLAGLTGAGPGIAAARLLGRPGRLGQTTKTDEPAPLTPLPALGAALAVAAGGLLVPLAIILLNGLHRPACDPLAGLPLFLLLAAPSALLACALGFTLGVLVRRAFALHLVAFVATLLASLGPLYTGPQVFVFHHLGGMLPGPIYDEAIHPTAALIAFRLCTLTWTAALLLVALWRLERPVDLPALRTALLPAAACGAAVLFSAQAERLHWQASVAALDQALGGRAEGERVVLHFPREKSALETRLLLVDAEASAAEVLAFFGTPEARPPRVDVFLFRSAEEKRLLLGAADTSFTKPWLRQVHTNDGPAPHPILRHELVHALGAALAGGPFGVPGWLGGLVPDMALIEGFAVAADWPAGESTVHQQTAALLRLGHLPDLRRLFEPGRFYAEAGPRAYAAAGSLLRFVWERQGASALLRAYRSPRGLLELGPLPPLVAAHADFLASVEVPGPLLAQAALRFSQPSILHRRCPHEVAELQQAALAAGQGGDHAREALLWQRCAELEPDDPAHLLRERQSRLRSGEAAAAEELRGRLLAHPKLSQQQRAQLLTELGDEAWGRGDTSAADAQFVEALALPQPDAQRRGLQARRYALAERVRWPAARRLLVDLDTGPDTWLLLRDLDLAEPASGFAAYLLSRQAQARGNWDTCVRFTAEALHRALPGPLFRLEALRLRAACAVRSGDLGEARAALEELAHEPSEARRLEAEAALHRLALQTGPALQTR